MLSSVEKHIISVKSGGNDLFSIKEYMILLFQTVQPCTGTIFFEGNKEYIPNITHVALATATIGGPQNIDYFGK